MNNKIKYKPELLAPVGSIESFWAAIEAGADAIYLSPKKLNARAYGKNFTLKEIADLKQTARKHGVRLYVALNSLMKESEILDCIEILSILNEIQPDALIIQDLGILHIAKKFFPNLRLHASTLMTIHNSYGVNVAKKLGFSRVVLARELTLKEIESIAQKVDCELEIFIHGAMCFSFSGLCLFSSYFGGRSSTRGRCVQPCRRVFKWGEKKGTFFSMDDLCAIELIPHLKRIGISSLKIEGRLKPAHYIYTVVKAYRSVLDATDKETLKKIEQAKENLKTALGRPMSTGFFLNKSAKNLICPTRTANTGLYIGKVCKLEKDTIELNNQRSSIEVGDKLRIVLKNIDKQFSTNVLAIIKVSPIKIKLSAIPDEFQFSLKDALVFKSDVAKKKNRKFSGIIEHFDNKYVYKNAAQTSKNIISTLRPLKKVKNIGKKRGQEVELFVAIKDLTQMRHLSLPRNIKGLFIELNSKNLKDLNKTKLKKSFKEKIIWHIKPIIFENELLQTEKLIHQLVRQGFRQFQISNISHLEFFTKKAKLFSTYQLNALNSLALFELNSAGIKYPHFSIETDLENLSEAIKRYKKSPLFTVYGFVPLFTTRVNHKLYNPKLSVRSLKHEIFFWKFEGSFGRLYPDSPICFIRDFKKLFEIGIYKWIIDLSYNIPKSYKHFKIPASPSQLSKRLRGRTFNLLGKLE